MEGRDGEWDVIARVSQKFLQFAQPQDDVTRRLLREFRRAREFCQQVGRGSHMLESSMALQCVPAHSTKKRSLDPRFLRQKCVSRVQCTGQKRIGERSDGQSQH
eukprot:m.364147 g.364147  ORF g.364147 m.364147 type:complete len:104 (+) comp28077_c0_seq1:3120-3431(+)